MMLDGYTDIQGFAGSGKRAVTRAAGSGTRAAAGGRTAGRTRSDRSLQLLPEALRSLFCIRVSFFQPPLI